MQLGIGSWCFPWAIGVPNYLLPKKSLNAIDLLRKAESLGVNFVQIYDNYPLHIRNEDELNEIYVTADTMGIELGIGTRGIEPTHMLKYLNIAKTMHAKSIRTIIDIPGEHVVDWIKQVIPFFEEADVTIAIENNEKLAARELANLVRKIGSTHFRINIDTINSLGRLEKADKVVKELAPYAIILHYKDFNITRVDHRMGFRVVGCAAGDGKVDADWLFETLQKKGINPKIVLELWPPFLETIEKTVQNEDEWVKKSILFLKTKIK